MYKEEFLGRQYDMEVEARRVEMDAIQERRLARLKDRVKRWTAQSQDEDAAVREFEIVSSAGQHRARMRSRR
jgi:hypothetical protein